MADTIMDRRDHVLMTFLVPFSFWASTFLLRWSSTKGPFFRERGMVSYSRGRRSTGRRSHFRQWSSGSSALLAGLAAAHDQGVAGLVGTAGAAFRLAVRVHRVASARGLALTTAVRVVDGVHGDTAHGRALALPAHPAGLAPVDVRLLGVADLAHRRAAAQVDVADLARGHPQLGERPVLGHQLDAGAGGPSDLGTAAGAELDRVDHRADRDVAHRQAVARLDVGAGPVFDPVALPEAVRREDV